MVLMMMMMVVVVVLVVMDFLPEAVPVDRLDKVDLFWLIGYRLSFPL
ncbi:unnamed protein product [Wuchereria bancrofti]|uniref:Neurotransmitter-gated ion-channel transmembrane domain-containing protein n=1 Tax=Wuchereria bancrofti TaxID=6293 RepID=A0A3P7G432_WUCBA|nr:unnamed protein product [Wuchereria bancrofti]